MSTQVQRRRGTTSQHSTFTGAVGEITVDTDKPTAVVHDGATAGGFPLEREAMKDQPSGYVGLNLLKINFKNTLGTITSWFTNSNTSVPKTYTFPDKSMTVGDAAGDPTIVTVGALNAGSITSGFGSIDIGVDQLSAGPVVAASLTVNGPITTGAVNRISINAPPGVGVGTLSIGENVTLSATGNAVVSDVNSGDNATNTQYSGLAASKEDVSNKATTFAAVNHTLYPTVQAVKAYADSLIVGLWNDRGSYDASVNTYPAAGGSGVGGAVLKGDIWTVSVAGTLGGVPVAIGDSVRALIDTPAQTAANWAVLENNIGYVSENSANKDASGGYAGLTLFKLNLRNAVNTVTSWFTTAATTARTWTMPDKDGTVAMVSDITGGTEAGSFTTLKATASKGYASGEFTGATEIFDNAAMTTGVGGVVVFSGDTNGAGTKQFAAIGGAKQNSTNTDVAGDLVLYARAPGANLLEYARLNYLGFTVSGALTASGSFASGANASLGASAGDSQLLRTSSVFTGNNSRRREWSLRNTAGADHDTSAYLTGHSVDTVWDTPSTARAWHKAIPSIGVQEWGDQGATVLSLNPSGVAVTGALSATGALTTASLKEDAAGNLGIGVVPAVNAIRSVQIDQGCVVAGDVNSNYMSGNWVYNGGEKFIGTNWATRYTQNSLNGYHAWYTSSAPGTAGNAITPVELMRLDASGNLGIGVAPSAWNDGQANQQALQIGETNPYYIYSDGAGTSYTGHNAFYSLAGTASWKYVGTGQATQYLQTGAGVHAWLTAPSGTAGNAITFVQGMTLDTNGNLLVGATSGSNHILKKAVTQGTLVAEVISSDPGTVQFNAIAENGQSGAGAAIFCGKNSATSRSGNFAGTLNASGADYAEYERNNGLQIIKGAIVGFKADGTLTNVYADAVRFAIKSTNPSYVGGDTWGNEAAVGAKPAEPQFTPAPYTGGPPPVEPVAPAPTLMTVLLEPETDPAVIAASVAALEASHKADAEYAIAQETYAAMLHTYTMDVAQHAASVEAAKALFDTTTYPEYERAKAAFEARLEEARQQVDRIAYSGKVPCNVLNATPGDYIVVIEAADGGIDGLPVTKANMTYAQSLDTVGRVNRLLPDGRCEVAVIIH